MRFFGITDPFKIAPAALVDRRSRCNASEDVINGGAPEPELATPAVAAAPAADWLAEAGERDGEGEGGDCCGREEDTDGRGAVFRAGRGPTEKLRLTKETETETETGLSS